MSRYCNKYVALGTKNICGREIFKKFCKEFYEKLYEINLKYFIFINFKYFTGISFCMRYIYIY